MKHFLSMGLKNKFLIVVFSSVFGGITAWACFTPEQMPDLTAMHPELNFEAVLHAHMGTRGTYRAPAGGASCIDGMADQFPCSNIDLVSSIALSDIGGGAGSDSWGWEDPQTGIEYAIIGRSNGVAFISLENPESPLFLGNLARPAGTVSNVWSDIKTFANHAYMVADNAGPHGIQIFDLTQLRDVTTTPVTFTETADFHGFQEAHNIVINEESGFAYIVGSEACNGGLYMVDLNDPTVLSFEGCFASDGYTHDAQCVTYKGPDADYAGKEICLASNVDTLTIVDVSDKANPVLVARGSYTGEEYIHQGWLTSDHRYFVMDDELDESRNAHNTRTYVWDMHDLDAPVVTGFYEADGPAIDHNQYTNANYTYQANYRRGLRILRLADLGSAKLEEVAYFDTFPNSDGNGFSGAWNVYPYYNSGLVMISDINLGFILVRPNPDSVDEVFSNDFETT